MDHQHSESCGDVFALLSDYLDLELPPDACRSVEEHLAGCPPCIEFAESLRRTVELCRAHKPAELPGPLRQQARDDLEFAYRKMLESRRSSGG